VSPFRRHLLGGMDQHIQTMRAVWPARPVGINVADKPFDHVSLPDRQPPRFGVDGVSQSKGTSTCGDGEREMMVEGRQQGNLR